MNNDEVDAEMLDPEEEMEIYTVTSIDVESLPLTFDQIKTAIHQLSDELNQEANQQPDLLA